MLEESVRNLIAKRVEALGYRIVLIKYFNRTDVLQIMIDFQDSEAGYTQSISKSLAGCAARSSAQAVKSKERTLEYVTETESRKLTNQEFERRRVYIGIEDCMKVTEELTLLLRVNEECAYDCAIEVSSPGIDRPLVSLSDFAKHKGQKVKLVMKEIVNGARKWNATIVDVVPDPSARVVFERYDAQKVGVRLDEIESAQLSLDGMNLFKH